MSRHDPLMHVCPGEHAVPHAPQFIGSDWMSTQTPEHRIDVVPQDVEPSDASPDASPPDIPVEHAYTKVHRNIAAVATAERAITRSVNRVACIAPLPVIRATESDHAESKRLAFSCRNRNPQKSVIHSAR
jgi:hypothetical protein